MFPLPDDLRSLTLLIAIVCTLPAATAHADIARLKNGGELRGVFLDSVGSAQRPKGPLRVETLTGGVITVSEDDVEFLARRNRSLEEFEWKMRLATPSVEAYWEIQEWCRDNHLKKERAEVLQQIIAIAPEHKDTRRLLGHTLHDGQWMSRDEIMASKGYVKYKGKYLFPQEIELLEAANVQKAAESEWSKKLNLWQDWLHSNNVSRQTQARENLEQLDDPIAVAPLVKLYRNDPFDEVRLIFVRTLARFEVPAAVHALVLQSLFDTSPTVRAAAMGGIEGKARAIAIPIYVKALNDSVNLVVLRAAVALGHYEDPTTIPDLIEALVTTHTYRQVVEERGYIAQGAIPEIPGSELVVPAPSVPLTIPGIPLPLPYSLGNANPTGRRNNSTTVPIPTPVTRQRLVNVTRQQQNLEVLTALRKMTREDFGFDERTWRLWWASQGGKFKPGPGTP